MGLKSLPILNKTGISMFWDNIWDSVKLYKKYNLGFYYLNDVLSYFVNENLYYYCIMKVRVISNDYRGLRGFKHISISKLKKSWNMRHFYLGKVIIFKQQGWVIFVINYFMTKRKKNYIKFNKSSKFRKLLRDYRNNYQSFKFHKEYYKYKF